MSKSTNLSHTDLFDIKLENPEGIFNLDDYQAGESMGYLLKRAVMVLSTAADQRLAPYELTHQQFHILMILKEHNCSTAAELARQTGVDTGSITRMLDRLEAKQIVRRVRSQQDRRVIHIRLTEQGDSVVQKMPIVAINVLNQHFAGFTREEVGTLKALLQKFLRHNGCEDERA